MRVFLIAAVAVLWSAAPASAATPLGIPCKDQNGVRFCQGDGSTQRVPSWDGVPLDVDVTLPPASAGDGPFPTIAMLHGYGGNKGDFEFANPEGDPESSAPGRLYHWNNTWFAQHGYAVLNYTARGFAKSCGTQDARTVDCFQQLQNQDPSAGGWIHLKDRRREAHDTQYLLGRLVDEGFAKPTKLGVTGISYGGGESIELAYLRDRIQRVDANPASFEPWVSPEKKIPMSLAAAFPRWPWSDLVSSLLPNGRFLDFDVATATRSRTPPGVPIQSYISGLYALGNVSGFYAPPGVDQTADISNWFARVGAGEPYSDPEATRILDEIYGFHQGFGTPTTAGPAPLLIQNGWTDDLFPPAEALRVYNSLRAANPDADIALQFGDLGHSRGSNKGNIDKVFNDQATEFFDRHLKGSSDASPPARGSVTVGTQTCPKPAPGGGPFTASSWPEIHPGAARFGFSDPQTVTSDGGNPQTGADLEPAVRTNDACKTFDDETADGTAVYRLPKTGDAFTLLGLPTVSANITTTGVNGQLDSRLWDVAPDGKQTLISRGAYRLLDNQSGPVTFQLHGNGWVFAAGHVPKLELLGTDAPYLRPSNGAFQVEVKDVVIELPTMQKPSSGADFGQGVQPVLGAGGTAPGGGQVSLKQRLRISYTPHRTRVGRRSRYLFRVRTQNPSTGKFSYVPGAVIRFAGKRWTTDRHGRLRTHHRFKRPGRRAVRASKAGYRGRVVYVRVLRRRR